MATEKILIFDEQGNAKRMKVRIARFLDNEPVTAADKTNIRTTLDVDGSQSGTFTTPLSVTSASDSSFTGGGKVGVGTSTPDQLIHASSSTGASLRLERDSVTITSGQSYGAIEWEGQDATGGGAASGVRAKIETEATGSSGDAALKFYTAAANDVATTRWTIDSSGSLVASSNGTGPRAASQPIVFYGTNSGSGQIDQGSIGTEAGTYYSNAGELVFKASNSSGVLTERFRVNEYGNIQMASGLGIDFGSTPDGSGATGVAEIFDDYETGAVTVGVTCGSGSITLNSSFQYLYYTKIGRTVNFFGELLVNSVSSPSGTIHLTGLPFTSLNQSGGRQAMSIYTRGLASDLGSVVGFVEPNTTTLYLRESGTTGVGNSIANAFQANTEIMFGGSYTAA